MVFGASGVLVFWADRGNRKQDRCEGSIWAATVGIEPCIWMQQGPPKDGMVLYRADLGSPFLLSLLNECEVFVVASVM